MHIHAKRLNRLKCPCFVPFPQVLRPGARYEVSVSGVRKGNESGSISTEFTTGEVWQQADVANTVQMYTVMFLYIEDGSEHLFMVMCRGKHIIVATLFKFFWSANI